MKTSAAHATAGDAVWDRLDLSKVLLDLAQTQVFSVAAGLMRHLDESGRERQKSILYQQQFTGALPQLRRSVLEQTGEVYDSIARRLAEEMERQQQQGLETSLEAFRHGRHLVTAGDAKRDRPCWTACPRSSRRHRKACRRCSGNGGLNQWRR